MTKAMRVRSTAATVLELKGQRNLLLVDYHKLKSGQAVQLRAHMKKDGVRMRVLKNAVARHALADLGHKALSERVAGMNAIVWADDPVSAVKSVYKFKEANNVLDVRGGTIDGLLLEPPQLKAISTLPPKLVLLAGFVGTLAAPAQNFVSVLGVAVAQIVQVLHAVAEKGKLGEPPAEPAPKPAQPASKPA